MSRLPRFLLLVLLLAASAGGLGIWWSAREDLPATRRPSPLTAGTTVSRELAPDETHAFTVALAPGERIELSVEQQGVDVELVFAGPDGGELVVVDSPTGAYGREQLVAIAWIGGTHRVVLRPFPGSPGGRYRLAVAGLGPATPRDRERAAAVAALARGTATFSGGSAEELREAAEALRAARSHAQNGGDAILAAEALDRLAHGEAAAGRLAEAERLHLEAAAELEAAGAPEHRRGFALALAGKAAFDAGHTERALGLFRRAAEALEGTADRREAGIAHYNVANSLERLGRVEPALLAYRRSARLLADLPGSETAAAGALHGLGDLEVAVGESALGRDHLEGADRLLREGRGEDRLQGLVLLALGRVALVEDDLARAGRVLAEARTLSRSAGDRRSAAVAEAALALVARRRGDLDGALAGYRRAIGELHDLGTELGADRGLGRGIQRLEARALHHLGSLQLVRGEPAAARTSYERALRLVRALGDPAYQADGRLGLARAARLLGDLDAARRHSEAGLALVEGLRAEILAPSLATSWFAGVQEHYRFAVDLALALDRRRPGEGWAGRGLELAERGRARALLDALGSSVGGPGAEAEQDLRERLARAEGARLHGLDAGAPDSAVEAAEQRVQELLVELEELVRERRAGDPRARRLRPEPLSVDAIRTRLTTSGTRLVEISLGPERSYLWLVEPEGVVAFELPPEAEIERLARRAHALLARGAGPEAGATSRQALCVLSREVLAPAASALSGHRLLVVPDGALSYLPFAALPDPRELDEGAPCAAAAPLAAAFEVVHLPSASAAARLAERPYGVSRRGTLAVLADPVFSAQDPRLGPPPGPAAAREPSGADRLPRLEGTRREAEAILAQVPPEERWAAYGFAASREAILAGRLSGYRFVHLATHGFLHDEHPELSGLVFSRFDRRGREHDGYLRVHELAGLDLAADLVVLSACRTALGKEVRGEGLVGLTQAFLAAGARSLLVSLWPVGDRSTAELMNRFYRALLADGLAPAAALRRAQIEMSADPRWREPYHWAGFVLVGTG